MADALLERDEQELLNRLLHGSTLTGIFGTNSVENSGIRMTEEEGKHYFETEDFRCRVPRYLVKFNAMLLALGSVTPDEASLYAQISLRSVAPYALFTNRLIPDHVHSEKGIIYIGNLAEHRKAYLLRNRSYAFNTFTGYCRLPNGIEAVLTMNSKMLFHEIWMADVIGVSAYDLAIDLLGSERGNTASVAVNALNSKFEAAGSPFGPIINKEDAYRLRTPDEFSRSCCRIGAGCDQLK